jgi:hypothetical protein
MELLNPDWSQARPSFLQVQEMCQRITLDPVQLPTEPFERVITSLRESHTNGGAYLAAFGVGSNPVFDWYASRNRLWEERLLVGLLSHPTICAQLPELLFTSHRPSERGFSLFDQFLFDGTVAHALHYGGAYWDPRGDGQKEKALALELSRAMFGLRFAEINCFVNHEPWTPWFRGVAWDLTAVLFDRRARVLWILAITDTD